MIPIELLEELDYFSHFPQQVTFCSHFPEDLPFFEELVRDVQRCNGRLSSEYRRRICAAAHVLKPAVCLPCYRQNRGRVLPNGDGFAVSMQNRVFRYEGGNFRSLSRLWDFTVRDVVFFGGYESLVHRRLDVIQRTVSLCRELGLDSRVQLANDPFFLDSTRNKRVYQRLGEVKYELVLTLPARREELAVSSFNLHRDFYSKVYDIRYASGDCVETACMGFGIDRWVYGFLAQKGLDQRRWPVRARQYVAGGQRVPGRES
jgi:seryl-tRNA synthetase